MNKRNIEGQFQLWCPPNSSHTKENPRMEEITNTNKRNGTTQPMWRGPSKMVTVTDDGMIDGAKEEADDNYFWDCRYSKRPHGPIEAAVMLKCAEIELKRGLDVICFDHIPNEWIVGIIGLIDDGILERVPGYCFVRFTSDEYRQLAHRCWLKNSARKRSLYGDNDD